MASAAKLWWGRLTSLTARRVYRVGRIAAIGSTIFGAGYSSGIKAALEDPEGTKRKVLMSMLQQQGGGEAGILDAEDPHSRFITRLGMQLIHAAESHIAQAIADLKESDGAARRKEELEAKLRALHDLPWKFVVINSSSINAFVTDVLPGYVFVHRGLLEAFDNDEDQLAFILGHELGHYLLEHGQKARDIGTALSILQLAVLGSVDPTGVVSAAIEFGAFTYGVNLAAVLPQSRQHEHEADELGLQLVARTCRDPQRAATAHRRLMELERAGGGDTSRTSIFSSHPATEERFANLQAQVPEARKLYDACGCSARKHVILRTLGLASGS